MVAGVLCPGVKGFPMNLVWVFYATTLASGIFGWLGGRGARRSDNSDARLNNYVGAIAIGAGLPAVVSSLVFLLFSCSTAFITCSTIAGGLAALICLPLGYWLSARTS